MRETRAVEEEVVRALRAEGTPLWGHDTDGWSRVSFIWIGEAPNGVVLQLNRFSDPIDIADTMLVRLADSRVHALTLRLSRGWIGSYLFVPLPFAPRVVLHRGVDLASIRDLAACATEDPFARECIPAKESIIGAGGLERLCVARGPSAPTTRLWTSAAVEVELLGVLPGAITGAELRLTAWSHEQADAHAPALLLADGEVWREQFPIVPELQRMIRDGALAPLHVLFLDSGGPRQRQLDYGASAAHSRALLEHVRRVAAQRLGTGPLIVAGQSLGGLFAALCAARHPDLVAVAIAQSPSLWWPACPPYEVRDGWFEERAKAVAGAPTLLEAGCYDWDVIDRARCAASLLTAQNALVGYHEVPAGHDVLQWQATFPGLIAQAIEHTRGKRR